MTKNEFRAMYPGVVFFRGVDDTWLSYIGWVIWSWQRGYRKLYIVHENNS